MSIDIKAERKMIEEEFTGVLKVAALANLDQYEKGVESINKNLEDQIQRVKATKQREIA